MSDNLFNSKMSDILCPITLLLMGLSNFRTLKKGGFPPSCFPFFLLEDICTFYHQVPETHFVVQTIAFRVGLCTYHVTVDFQLTHACSVNGVSSCRYVIGFAVGRDNEGTFFHVFRFLPKHFFVAVGIEYDDAIGEFLLAIVFLHDCFKFVVVQHFLIPPLNHVWDSLFPHFILHT